MNENIYSSVEEYEKNCYLFAPSVSKRKTVGGKSYYVRRVFPRRQRLRENNGTACGESSQ